jgi:hypothetical protein
MCKHLKINEGVALTEVDDVKAKALDWSVLGHFRFTPCPFQLARVVTHFPLELTFLTQDGIRFS